MTEKLMPTLLKVLGHDVLPPCASQDELAYPTAHHYGCEGPALPSFSVFKLRLVSSHVLPALGILWNASMSTSG